MKKFDLSIDPGVDLGWALWNEDQLWTSDNPRPAEIYPVEVGVISPRKDAAWQLRSDLIMSAMKDLVREIWDKHEAGIKTLYCEWPAYHDGFAGHRTATTGALVKLCVAAGRVMQFAAERGMKFVPVRVADWKGQVSKPIVMRRIRRRLGDAACRGFGSSDHVWDAVGIGLYVRGYLNGPQPGTETK